MSDNKRDVLFQRLGTIWYAFTEINGEINYAPLPPGTDPHTQSPELYEVVEKLTKPPRRRPLDEKEAA